MAVSGGGNKENILSFLSLLQSILLGSFACILAAHRSDILDKPNGGGVMGSLEAAEQEEEDDDGAYEAPVRH